MKKIDFLILLTILTKLKFILVKILSETRIEQELVLFSFPKKRILKYIMTGLVIWVLTLIIWLIPNLEHNILVYFNPLRQPGQFFREFWNFYTRYIVYIFGVIVTIMFFCSLKIKRLKNYRLPLLMSIGLISFGLLIVDFLFKITIQRPRPWITFSDLYPIYFARGYSFPSGHTMTAFSMTIILITALISNDKAYKRSFLKYIFAIILLCFSISIGLSRILVGVHFPSDVLFSVGFSIILEVVFIVAFSKLLKSHKISEKNILWYFLIFIIALVLDLVLNMVLG